MANALDYVLEMSEFEIQLLYYIYYQTNTIGESYDPLYTSFYGLIVSLLLFCKALALDESRMPWNKETKPYK